MMASCSFIACKRVCCFSVHSWWMAGCPEQCPLELHKRQVTYYMTTSLYSSTHVSVRPFAEGPPLQEGSRHAYRPSLRRKRTVVEMVE
jgi:hypothetical protein